MSRVRPLRSVLTLLGLAIGSVAFGEPQEETSSPEPGSPLVEIAPGVLFAPQEPARRFNDANAVFLVDTTGIVAIDAPASEDFLTRALDALQSRTYAPLRVVINTHWHEDHTLGNRVYRQRFGETFEIIGHQSLRRDVAERAQPQFEATTERWVDAIVAAESRLEQGVDRQGEPLDEAGLAKLATDIAETKTMVEERKVTTILAPTLGYTERITLDHGLGPIELFYHRAHTGGDTVVYLPEQKVLITGDLLDALPFGGHGYPSSWLTTLDALAELDFEWILPGHGPAFEGRDQLELIRRYLGDIVAHAQAAVAQGQTLAEAQESLDLSEVKSQLVDDETAERNWAAFVPQTLERAYAEASGETLD